MATLRALTFPDAEWTYTQAGGVLGIFNGREQPLKYDPASKTVKRFGLFKPEAEMAAAGLESPDNVGFLAEGTYVGTFVEVDTNANEGQGLRSGPPRDSEGVEFTVTEGGSVSFTFPLGVVNGDADERWVYMSLDDGAWPTLGRVARVPIGVQSFDYNGADETTPEGAITVSTPDFTNYPLDIFRGPAPNKNYPVKMNRRLLMWGGEPMESRFDFTIGSNIATWAGGDIIDHGVIGAVIYPQTEQRGYLITDYYAGSPGQIEFQDDFVGTEASSEDHAVTTRIVRPTGELAWSEPDDYENFPAANTRYVELSGSDPESGCGVANGRGLFFTVHKTFGLDFNTSPAVNLGSFIEISTQIGCLSHRTIQDIGGLLVWLSESGLAASSGGAPRLISDEVGPEFDSLIREQTGRVRDAFAVHWAAKKKYMCFIPIAGDVVGCSRCIVMDYETIPGEPQFRFSVYDFTKEFTTGTVERHSVTSGDSTTYEEYPVFGDKDGYTWSFGIGDADGPDSGTVSGTVDSASTSPNILTDTSATFDTDGLGLAGMIVTVRRSGNADQEKLIASNSADTLRIDQEWDWTPSEGDTYWVGGIEAYYETAWSSFGGDQGQKKLHSLISTHKVEGGGTLDTEIYTDFSSTEEDRTNEGTTFSLSTASGRSYLKLSGKKCWYGKARWSNELPDEPWTLKSATITTSEPDNIR